MDPAPTRHFELPRQIERLMAALSARFAKQGKTGLQSVLVNAQHHVQEETTYDSWNGGTFGHTVHLKVPVAVFHDVSDDIKGARDAIRTGLNDLASVINEFIEDVTIELLDDPGLSRWREDSGVLLQPFGAGVGDDAAVDKLWKPSFLRVFLSHKAQHKSVASAFKIAMDRFGASCFVAHEDVEPNKLWQAEIERALFSMDVLVALMTPDFADSNWTDQEVGIAIGRGVPVIPIRMGTDPYGFIGKIQALPGGGKAPAVLAKDAYELLWTVTSLRGRLAETLVTRLERAENYSQANDLMHYVEKIERATPALIARLEAASQNNGQVGGAFEVQERMPAVLATLKQAAPRDVPR
jgi:TIR domain